MTDEEKAEITKEYLNNTFKQTEENQLAIMIGSKCFYEGLEKGLAEGRKEGYEQGKNNERELQCGKKNYEKDLAKLEKENARLSKMLEMAINEVLLCGKQMKVEHPSMIVWTEETFRAELEKRVENEK